MSQKSFSFLINFDFSLPAILILTEKSKSTNIYIICNMAIQHIYYLSINSRIFIALKFVCHLEVKYRTLDAYKLLLVYYRADCNTQLLQHNEMFQGHFHIILRASYCTGATIIINIYKESWHLYNVVFCFKSLNLRVKTHFITKILECIVGLNTWEKIQMFNEQVS